MNLYFILTSSISRVIQIVSLIIAVLSISVLPYSLMKDAFSRLEYPDTVAERNVRMKIANDVGKGNDIIVLAVIHVIVVIIVVSILLFLCFLACRSLTFVRMLLVSIILMLLRRLLILVERMKRR